MVTSGLPSEEDQCGALLKCPVSKDTLSVNLSCGHFHFISCPASRSTLFLPRLAVIAIPVGDQRTAANPIAVDLIGSLIST